MAGDGSDRWIKVTPTGIEVRGYYFPWGTKRIPFASIKSVRRVQMTALRGKGRIWGTGDPRYWASLDPKRPVKQVGLILDLGKFVHPFITPDDPDAVESAIRAHADLGPTSSGTSPVV